MVRQLQTVSLVSNRGTACLLLDAFPPAQERRMGTCFSFGFAATSLRYDIQVGMPVDCPLPLLFYLFRGIYGRTRRFHHTLLLAIPLATAIRVCIGVIMCICVRPLTSSGNYVCLCFPKLPPFVGLTLALVQEALDMVQQGDTIKVTNGNWFEDVKTVVRTASTKALDEPRLGSSACGRVYSQTLNIRQHRNFVRYTFRDLDLVCNTVVAGSGGVRST